MPRRKEDQPHKLMCASWDVLLVEGCELQSRRKDINDHSSGLCSVCYSASCGKGSVDMKVHEERVLVECLW